MDLLLAATREAESRHFWFTGLRRFARPLVARAVDGVAEPVLLDGGCGTGANLTMLGAAGRTFGCEYTWTGLEYARRAGQRVVRASVAQLPFPDASFDVVTSFDVLYCLSGADERAAVSEMARVLRPGGGAVVNVAALDALRGSHSILAREQRRYTKRSLRDLLEGGGLTVEWISYAFATLVPILLPLRSLERLRGLPPESGAGGEIRVPPAPVNAALKGLLAVEAAALRVVTMPFGSSLLALARKEDSRPPALEGRATVVRDQERERAPTASRATAGG